MTTRRRLAGTALAVAAVLASGCPGSVGDEPGPCDGTYALLAHLRVDQVSHPTPVMPGSIFEVRGESFIPERSCVVPEVALVGNTALGEREAVLETEVSSANDLTAALSQQAASALGSMGSFVGVLEVRFRASDGSGIFTASTPVSFELASTLTPDARSIGQTSAYLNDSVSVSGEGFISGEEGTTEIVVEGTFTPEGGGEQQPVSGLRLAATPVDPADRGQTSFLWSPYIGGLEPGRFEGTITPENLHPSGERSSGRPLSIVVDQEESFIIGISPEVVSLGQIAEVTGRGFIGGAEGTTTVRLEGDFTPYRSSSERVTLDLVGTWESGSMIRYAITVTSDGGFLHAVDFGAHRGVFEGQATPILIMGSDRHDGISSPVTINLGPVLQVCWVRFSPGFSDSLELFGIGALDAEIQTRVLERMHEIYCPSDDHTRCVNVVFRTERPDDFYDGGFAVLDIGGPDPNGVGLFGYDNTPGKDVGNLRLHDHVGGENALGALDGFGYGGVFIESMLFWSEHPPAVLGARPPAAPPPDPRFDQAFDAVREQEVVAGEYPGGAEPGRLADIEAAVHFLTSMVADTAAHEFGHSLGLAQPYGGPTDYHNAIPREGCLMDAGRDRPLEERARLDGNEGARFCGENFFYLQDLLPAE